MNSKYRHELKYLISNGQLALLKARLNGLIPLDSHVGKMGMYTITSLYFDDYYNRCYYENENGSDPREKFRIRIYNHSTARITLECKRKERGKTLKTSCPLTLEQSRLLMEGKMLPDIRNQPPVLQKLLKEMQQRQLHPVVIVEYERVPYVCTNGNVRITIDTHVASSSEVSKFLSGNYAKRPIMPVGLQLLEVKYDQYLPDTIYRTLQIESLQQTAYSKYYLCRKYSL